MIEFHPITIADKELIESYTLNSPIRNCDLSFANIYCWQPLYKSAWGVVDGALIIRFNIDGDSKLGYMQPIGKDGSFRLDHIVPQLAADAHSHGERLRFIGLTDDGRRSLTESYGDNFALFSDPSFEDYIYLRSALSTLSGKKLQPKRNHQNQFLKLYGDRYTFKPLTADIFSEALALDCRWRREHKQDCNGSLDTPERVALMRAFDNFEELGLIGGALYVDDRMVGFTYGSAINGDTFCIHIEKCNSDVTGAYTIINRLFAESLPSQYIYINREEDLGISGLRQAKRSYYPTTRQEKFRAIYLHHHEAECRVLWSNVFGDETSFIDEFLINHYADSNMLRVVDGNNHYVSMLHIVPFNAPELGRVAYIYGVATALSHRGKGLASKLMNAAIEKINAEGYDAAILIPGEEWLKRYYSKFGFQESAQTIFDAYNNFDFGSGDTSKDISMIRIFNSAIDLPSQDSTLTLSK